jgi:hypothetical protein
LRSGIKSADLDWPVRGQDVAAGPDALAFGEVSVTLDRLEPIDALTAAQVQDLRLLVARAHPEPNGEGERFHLSRLPPRYLPQEAHGPVSGSLVVCSTRLSITQAADPDPRDQQGGSHRYLII